MQATKLPEFLTIRDVASACGVRMHQAKYAVDEYSIEPRQRAGIIRLFHRDQLPTIKSALARISGRREVLAHVG
jgi:hypothetical protein